MFNPKVPATLSMLFIDAVNGSNVNVSAAVDTLALKLDGSSVVVDDAVQLLQGNITNSSSAGVRTVNVFNFKKDKSSRFNHWN